MKTRKLLILGLCALSFLQTAFPQTGQRKAGAYVPRRDRQVYQPGSKVAIPATRAAAVQEGTKGYLWNPEKRIYQQASKVLAPAMMARVSQDERKVVLSHNMVWVMPDQPNNPGHWQRFKAGERERILALKDSTNLYPVKMTNYLAYPYFKVGNTHQVAPEKILVLERLNENGSYLANKGKITIGLTGNSSVPSVYYFEQLDIGCLTLAPSVLDCILVTDSLLLTKANRLNNTIISINKNRPYVKIIARRIEYESPLGLSLIGQDKNGNAISDFVFSAENIMFKSRYSDLKMFQLSPPPPIAAVLDSTTNTRIYQNHFGESEKILLNRLYVRLLEQVVQLDLNTNSDSWVKDKLWNQFQSIRYQKMFNDVLAKDLTTQKAFAKVCAEFDTKLEGFRVEKRRDFNDLVVLIDGEVGRLPFKPINYYVLPSIAKLLPALSGESNLLGTVSYNPANESKLKLTMEAELTYDQARLASAQAELAQKGVVLQGKLPQQLVSIEEQPLKINGRTLGKIFPISNKMVRLEIDLAEETKSLIELFPAQGAISFKIDFTMAGSSEKIAQTFSLDIDPAIFKKLDYNKPLDSFVVADTSQLTGSLLLVSNLDATKQDEGALDRVEALVEIHFSGRTDLHGPYRLSSYNTLASKQVIPFVKRENDYRVTVSGRAFYENGARNIVPFTPAIRDVISIDEAVLQAATE